MCDRHVQVKDGVSIGPHVATLDVSPNICRAIEDGVVAGIPAGNRRHVEQLLLHHVFRPTISDTPQQALRFVVAWDAHPVSYVVGVPAVISIAIAAIWPMVAVLKFGADVQSSVQTGAAVASFIITTGALVMGLATLLDALAKQ
ncbi:hypothetical protein EV126DRAFT_24940 [Verticillium dahliae]|nr:hypothetical protein EV126DRAFT_24940 [Verticillium dahliae]